MTQQLPPGPGYGPGYPPGPNTFGAGPHPNPYPNAGYGNQYAPGPTGHPSPYQQQPYPPQGYYGPPAPNPNAYTSWMDRVLASVIDQIPVFVIFFVGYAVLMVGVMSIASEDSADGPSDGAVAVMVLAMFALFAVTVAFPVWNYGYRQGRTGQSIGKQVMKFKVVSEKTGRPIGFGMSLLRQIAHIADGIFYIGYLMPLWDSKRQTIADKVMTTVCVPAPVAAPAPPIFPGPQGGPNPYAYPPR